MAWERSFEKRVLKIREKELRYQRLNFLIEVNTGLRNFSVVVFNHRLLGTIQLRVVRQYPSIMLVLFSRSIVGRAATPLFVTLVSFWHFAVYRGQTLTPSIAFTSMAGNVVVYIRV